MEKNDRRQVSLAGIGLIGAGAVLGLTLAAPASAAPPDNPRSGVAEAVVEQQTAPIIEQQTPKAAEHQDDDPQ
jgi:hypothetical protein